MKDRAAKKRGKHQSGAASTTAKIPEQDIEKIRNSSLSASKLAAQYGVVKQTICNIKNRTTWKEA